jgi:hypothetical protein
MLMFLLGSTVALQLIIIVWLEFLLVQPSYP